MAENWEHHDHTKPSCQCAMCMDRFHSETRPHWSVGVDWPADRWDPMHTAPSKGPTMINVRGRTADGRVLEPMHYAYGGGEEQPPFRGWFIPMGEHGYQQVSPVEWQPLTVKKETTCTP